VANKTPEELLALKTDYRAAEAEQLLDRFVREKVNLPDTRKWQIIMKVRGFFRTNYRDLQRAAGICPFPQRKTEPSNPSLKKDLQFKMNVEDDTLHVTLKQQKKKPQASSNQHFGRQDSAP